MSDFWCLRRGEKFSDEQLVSVYDKTLAGVLQRYNELVEQYDYISVRKDPQLKKRIDLLFDIILDLYTALRCMK